MDELRDNYDVVVIGGGPAGLNGALMLARSRRSVVVIDAGAPRNSSAEGVHGLLGHDGVPPAELLARGRNEVRSYGGQIVAGEVAAVSRDCEFVVKLTDGRAVRGRRLLMTTGLVDELPQVPGLRERWGRDVIHCPYCHGWEARDRAIGVPWSGPMSVHQALLFRQLSDDVVIFTDTANLDVEQREQLAAQEVRIIDGAVASLEVAGDRLVGFKLGDGTTMARDVVVVSPRMVAQAAFLGDLGLATTEHPAGAGEHIVTDAMGRTNVPGVWAAGNVTDIFAQVGASAAAGAFAAAQINADLVAEETRAAVEVMRDAE